MKKNITILLSFLFISFQAVKAEMGAGITGAMHFFDASGTETTRQSLEKNNGSHSEDVLVPELFIETIADNGAAFGLSYIPTRELGSKSGTDTGESSGTYTAEAELDNVLLFYADVPLSEIGSYPIYAKLGIQHATIVTLESSNSGSTYPDEDVLGLSIGLGTKGDLNFGENLYYKAEATFTKFEDYEATSAAGNKVEAQLEDMAVKFSIGYKF